MYDKVNRILGRVNKQTNNSKTNIPGQKTPENLNPIYKSPIVKAYQAAIEERRGKTHVNPWTYGSVKDRINNMKSTNSEGTQDNLVSIIQQYRAGNRTFPTLNVQTSLSKIIKPVVAQINPKKK